jgi:hypothetical protein
LLQNPESARVACSNLINAKKCHDLFKSQLYQRKILELLYWQENAENK